MAGCSGYSFPLSVAAFCFLCLRAVRIIQLLPGQCIAHAEHDASLVLENCSVPIHWSKVLEWQTEAVEQGYA